jgi:phosphoribosylaminoimidazolecarboxamide formyltransferase/IMP cyclohydrolase
MHAPQPMTLLSRLGLREKSPDTLPAHVTLGGTKALDMRYGENPHQGAALYLTGEKRPGVAGRAAGAGQAAFVQQHQRCRCGLRAGLQLRARRRPGGGHHQTRQSMRRGAGGSLDEAYDAGPALRPGLRLWRHRGDEHPADRQRRRRITAIFTEVIIAPDADDGAKALIAKKKNLAPSAHRRSGGPARARAHDPHRRRRLSGAEPRHAGG